jgi:hypothetical protein
MSGQPISLRAIDALIRRNAKHLGRVDHLMEWRRATVQWIKDGRPHLRRDRRSGRMFYADDDVTL